MKPTSDHNNDAKSQRPGDRDSARSVSEDGTRAPGPLARARRRETGLSVTPGLTISEPTQWEFLGAGIDSLDLGFYVDWGNEAAALFERLQREKERASGTKGILFEGESECLMLPSGSRNYAFHLQYPEFHLFIGEQDRPIEETPNVYVSLNSSLLWRQWIHNASRLAINAVESLGGRFLGARPSRVDLCADFHIPGGLTLELLRQSRVPANDKYSHHEVGDTLETFYAGQPKSDTRCRIYDKGKEVISNGLKLWFLDIWGLSNPRDVWRVEFQLRRKTLKKFGINDLAGMEKHLAGLWNYLTTQWFSLRNRTQNRIVTHCEPLKWWKAVEDAGRTFGEPVPLERFDSQGQADVTWYICHIAGCFVAMMARLGIGDLEVALAVFCRRMRQYFANRSWKDAYSTACLRIGRDPNAGPRGDVTP